VEVVPPERKLLPVVLHVYLKSRSRIGQTRKKKKATMQKIDARVENLDDLTRLYAENTGGGELTL